MSAVNSFCRQRISCGTQGVIEYSQPSSTFVQSIAVALECDAKENSSQNSQNNTTESQDAKISQLYQQAVKIIDSDNSEREIIALKLLVSILKIDPYHAQAQCSLGHIYEFYVKNGEKDAVEWYTAAKANGYLQAEQALARVLGKLKPHINKPTHDGKLKSA